MKPNLPLHSQTLCSLTNSSLTTGWVIVYLPRELISVPALVLHWACKEKGLRLSEVTSE